MTKPNNEISLRSAAIIAGYGLLAMTLFAVFAIYVVFQNIIVPGDVIATVKNIMTNKMQFRIGISTYLIIIILDVVVAWALYVFLKPINRSLSLLAAWFRLVYSIIFAVALVNYTNVLQLLSGASYLESFGTDQLYAQVMHSITTFNDGWAIGLIFFGLHLALVGYVVIKSVNIPKILGIILVIAGLGYFVDYMCKFLFSNYELLISQFVGWGELLLMFWLIFKGVKMPEKKMEN